MKLVLTYYYPEVDVPVPVSFPASTFKTPSSKLVASCIKCKFSFLNSAISSNNACISSLIESKSAYSPLVLARYSWDSTSPLLGIR